MLEWAYSHIISGGVEMFRKILFPTDFSQGSYKAVKNFVQKNKTDVGELILLNVVDESVVEEMMDGYSLFYELYDTEKNELKEVEKKLSEARMKKLKEKSEFVKEILKPAHIKLLVKFGLPYKKILQTADEEDVSLILLPSHGRLSFTHEFLGSTTYRVLKKTKRPVLLIKTHEEV